MFFVLLFSSAHSDLSTFCPSHLKATYKNMVVLENTLRNAHASLKTILLLAVPVRLVQDQDETWCSSENGLS